MAKFCCGTKAGYFEGSRCFLGPMSDSEMTGQACVIQRFESKKDRWVVRLSAPRFNGKQVLVADGKLKFECYVVQPEHLEPLPDHLHVACSSVAGAGEGLFCRKAFKANKQIFDESPFMVANSSGSDIFAPRWHAYWATMQEHGPKAPALQALNDMSDGGIADRYLSDATTLFKAMVGKSPTGGDGFAELLQNAEGRLFAKEEVRTIASVLARWQSNSHAFELPKHHSAMFRYCCKMQHSCEASCRRRLCPDTGRMILETTRPIAAGEMLTISYMGSMPEFQRLSVEGRRLELQKRGFCCMCTRCVRESGESTENQPSSAPRPLRVLTREEMADRLFAHFDEDKDGVLKFPEIRALVKTTNADKADEFDDDDIREAAVDHGWDVEKGVRRDQLIQAYTDESGDMLDDFRIVFGKGAELVVSSESASAGADTEAKAQAAKPAEAAPAAVATDPIVKAATEAAEVASAEAAVSIGPGRLCAGCRQTVSKTEFSAKQLKQGDKSRCKTCVAASSS